MNPVVVAAIGTLSVAIFVLTWLWARGDGGARRARSNLTRGLTGGPRAAAPPRRSFLDQAAALYPKSARGYLERLIVHAGRQANAQLEQVLARKILLALVCGAGGFALAAVSRNGVIAGLAIFVTLLAFFFPDLRLYSRGIERRQAIRLQLPDTLDQMSIAVRAGLGFDAAMVRVARNGKGELAGEMIRTMQDIQVGQPRRMAYADLGIRCGVPELRRFTRAIIQAETYGLALSDVLHTQADELRIQRRQRAEMKAMEIPVKVVFPLILFIMPAMFVVLVGPAGIRIAEAFSQFGR